MIIEVNVNPNSKKFSIAIRDGRIKISLQNAPENNKANIELVKGFSNLIGRPVTIVSGRNSRRKRLSIDINEEDWASFLKTL